MSHGHHWKHNVHLLESVTEFWMIEYSYNICANIESMQGLNWGIKELEWFEKKKSSENNIITLLS